MRPVHVIRPLEESDPAELLSPTAAETEADSFLFGCEIDMSDGEDGMTGTSEGPDAKQRKLALQRWSALASLLAPPDDLLPQLTGMRADEVANQLQALGYTVELNISAGGGYCNLRHSFFSIWRSGSCGFQQLIVDDSFAEQFVIAHPTPRYAFILSALPRVLVASLDCVIQAIIIMSGELARAFSEQGRPLPPWRKLSSLTSKYTAAHPVAIQGTSVSQATSPTSTAARSIWSSADKGPSARSTLPGVSAASRKAQQVQQVQQRIACKLAQWGLDPDAMLLAASTGLGREPAGRLASSQHPVRVGFQVDEEEAGQPQAGQHAHKLVGGDRLGPLQVGQGATRPERRVRRLCSARGATQLWVWGVAHVRTGPPASAAA